MVATHFALTSVKNMKKNIEQTHKTWTKKKKEKRNTSLTFT